MVPYSAMACKRVCVTIESQEAKSKRPQPFIKHMGRKSGNLSVGFTECQG